MGFQDINIQMRLMGGSPVHVEVYIVPVTMVIYFRRVV